MTKNILSFLAWLLLCFATSAIGALGSIQAQSFYVELQQPSWAPPPWVFGPVWTALYALMAISAWLIWRTNHPYKRNATLLFLTQLVLNALWSWLFFAWRLGAVSVVEILMLWVAILTNIVVFWRIKPMAGALLIPYLLWVSFAAALNITLWQLNPSLL